MRTNVKEANSTMPEDKAAILDYIHGREEDRSRRETHPKTQHTRRQKKTGSSENLCFRVCCVFACSLFFSGRAPKHTSPETRGPAKPGGPGSWYFHGKAFVTFGVPPGMPRTPDLGTQEYHDPRPASKALPHPK